MMDTIKINKMAFYGYHGCCDFEKERGQTFYIDVAMMLDLKKPGQTDDLRDTVNYSAVFDTVRAITEGKSFQLIERLAEVVAATLLKEYPIQLVRVRVHKPSAPIKGMFEDVSVAIERSRQDG